MGFVSLQHIRNRRSTSRGFCLPASFRLQGLVTLLAVSSLRFRAGSVSHRRRSWDSPFGAFSSRKVSACFHGDEPTYRFTGEKSHRRNGGPASQAAVSGFSPSRESLAPERVFSTPAAGCSLGFYPSRVRTRKPGPGSRPVSSHTLHRGLWLPRGKATTSIGAPECRSALASSCSFPRTLGREAKQATLRGFLHRHHPEH
jgi:hypothetical protein